MAKHQRIVRTEMIDNTIIPVSCVRCDCAIDYTTSHFGRMIEGFSNSLEYGIHHSIRNGEVHKTLTYTEKFFPVKKTGEFCNTCYETLHAIAWRDTAGKLRRAFEGLSRPVVQPNNDDFDTPSVVKGLYAPHASRGAQRPHEFEHRSSGSKLSKAAIEEKDIKKESLIGFGKEKRSFSKTRKVTPEIT